MINFFLRKKNIYPDITRGNLSGVYSEGTGVITNSIDSTAHNYRYCYDTGLSNIPILFIAIGWGNHITLLTQASMRRWAALGFFVIAADIEQGTYYANGKNVHLIWDTLKYLRKNYPICSKTRSAINGYSAGGAYTLAAISCFPDSFIFAVDCFGISDFGYSVTDSWYIDSVSYANQLNTLVGNRASYLNDYYSRRTRESVNNYLGKLFMFHDSGDITVLPHHSDLLNDVLTIDHEYHKSTDGTYGHASPDPPNGIVTAENYWGGYLQDKQELSMPNSSNLIIMNGMLKTSRFEIIQNNYDCKHVATLTYNLATSTFIVTPLTGNQKINIKYYDVIQEQTISSQTTFQF